MAETKRLTHDQYFLAMLKLVAARSTCARRSVGAIIVDGDYKILSTGYNGVPSGYVHCIDTACPGANDLPGDTRRCMAVHAEVNAVLQCSRIYRAITMYVSCTPCKTCALMICNTSIRRVVSLELYADSDGAQILRDAGVTQLVVPGIEITIEK